MAIEAHEALTWAYSLIFVFLYEPVSCFVCSNYSYWGVQSRAEKLMLNGIRQVTMLLKLNVIQVFCKMSWALWHSEGQSTDL